MPDLDFAGLAEQARAAFKPRFADVERRARRRRRNAGAAGAAIAVAVLLAGTYAIQGMAGGPPPPGTTPTPAPSYTQLGPGALPYPTWTMIDPQSRAWDVTEPDPPTNLISMRVGDINHIYVDYKDCKGSQCTRMLASSADRGQTWRRHQMPFDVSNSSSIVAAHGTTIIAVIYKEEDRNLTDPSYVASLDGGATWQTSSPRIVDALPAGWPLMSSFDRGALKAFDPTTGDIAVRQFDTRDPAFFAITLTGLPPEAGIWQIRRPTQRSPTDPVVGRHLAFSRDGSIWQKRTLPDALLNLPGFPIGKIMTMDGTTLVAVQDGADNNLRLHISTDGGLTWRTGGAVPADGPFMHLLPTREGPILLETGSSVYRSTDGGVTLQRVGPSIGSRPRAVPGGYAEESTSYKRGVWLSPDGAVWTYVPAPPLP